MVECLIVGVGGFIGAVCRYLLGQIPLQNNRPFPLKTFFINILGAFVIGIIAASALKNHSISPRTVLFLKVGICGGFTTFSSFALETGELLKSGNIGMGFLYAVLSVIAGILAVFPGEMIISCRS